MNAAIFFCASTRFDFLEIGEGQMERRVTFEPWFETHIAGTMYREGLTERLDDLQPGQRLMLVAEPENPHDWRAIRFETLSGLQLGYVPQRINTSPYEWLAQGGRLEAELLKIQWRNHWLEIIVRVDKVM